MAHRMKIGIFPSLQVFWSTFFCRGRLIGRVGWLSSSFYPNDTDMYQSPLEWNIELTNWVGRHDHPLAEDESKKEEEESAILLQLGLLLATAATTTWNRVTQPPTSRRYWSAYLFYMLAASHPYCTANTLFVLSFILLFFIYIYFLLLLLLFSLSIFAAGFVAAVALVRLDRFPVSTSK